MDPQAIAALRIGRRAAAAILVAVAGALFCLANDNYWQSKVPPVEVVGGGYPPIKAPAFADVGGDLIVAFPFYVLAVCVLVTRIRLVATVAGAAAVATLAAVAYRDYHVTDSSTAGLAFLLPLLLGSATAVSTVAADEAARLLGAARRRRALNRRPGC